MSAKAKIYTIEYMSPIGIISISGTEASIISVDFVKKENVKPTGSQDVSPVVEKCLVELDEYFNGKRKSFSIGYCTEGTEFQEQVWAELENIPYGETVSYKYIAMKLKNKGAAGAVGNALGKNPLPIILPCHRVRASNGSVGGFTGGIEKKKWLLELEKQII